MIYGTKLIKKTKTLINKEDEFVGFYGTPSFERKRMGFLESISSF